VRKRKGERTTNGVGKSRLSERERENERIIEIE